MRDQLLQLRDACRLREAPFVQSCLEAILERDHQLDPLERAEAELLERGGAADVAPVREARDERFEGVAGAGRDGRFARSHPVAQGAALQLARPLGARQLSGRPDRGRANALVILQAAVGGAHDRILVRAGVEHHHRVDAFLAAVRDADDRRFADARHLVEHALDVLGKDVQPLGRHDHFLLAPLDEDAALVVALADVAGVEPAVGVEDRGGIFVVAARDVLAANQNLAIVGDADLDALDGRTDRALARLERVIERDDRCGFGQAVPLDDREPHAPPEFLEVGRQRRGADDKRPELEAERGVHAPVAPPAPGNRDAGRRRLLRFGPRARRVLAQHGKHLRHADEDRDAACLDQPQDVVRVEAANM